MDKNTLKLIRILATFVIFGIILYFALELVYSSFNNPFRSNVSIVIMVIFGLILVAMWIPELLEILWFIH